MLQSLISKTCQSTGFITLWDSVSIKIVCSRFCLSILRLIFLIFLLSQKSLRYVPSCNQRGIRSQDTNHAWFVYKGAWFFTSSQSSSCSSQPLKVTSLLLKSGQVLWNLESMIEPIISILVGLVLVEASVAELSRVVAISILKSIIFIPTLFVTSWPWLELAALVAPICLKMVGIIVWHTLMPPLWLVPVVWVEVSLVWITPLVPLMLIMVVVWHRVWPLPI